MIERRYTVRIEVNGQLAEAQVPARLTLVDFLRDTLRLTGTHVGCEHGICGACSVLLDGEPVRSCLIYAVQAEGCAVTTIEGLARADGTPGALQDAFCETHALQCGYCTPGMMLTAVQLLVDTPHPNREQIAHGLKGNLCRCTGYSHIIDAVERAAGAK